MNEDQKKYWRDWYEQNTRIPVDLFPGQNPAPAVAGWQTVELSEEKFLQAIELVSKEVAKQKQEEIFSYLKENGRKLVDSSKGLAEMSNEEKHRFRWFGDLASFVLKD